MASSFWREFEDWKLGYVWRSSHVNTFHWLEGLGFLLNSHGNDILQAEIWELDTVIDVLLYSDGKKYKAPSKAGIAG